MWNYIVKRVLQAIPTLLVISFLIFSLLYVTPGDPVYIMLGSGDTQSFTEEEYEAARHELGLDKPMLVRYADFLKMQLKEIWENLTSQMRTYLQPLCSGFQLPLC